MLSRWSRLKSEAAANKLAPDVAAETTSNGDSISGEQLAATSNPDLALDSAPNTSLPHNATGQIAASEALELPNIADLTKDSDFTPFMQQGVPLEAKNAALRKLFTDPHFNEMDGLDIYIDDYGKPDPIPEAMLKRLMSSKLLGLYEAPEELAQEPFLEPVLELPNEPAAESADAAQKQLLELTGQSFETPIGASEVNSAHDIANLGS